MRVKTVMEMTSAMTLSWNRLNGPPLPWKPILLAGIMKQYSSRAMPQEKRMVATRGQEREMPRCASCRCPYHAKVMNTLLTISSRTVSN